MDVNGAQYALKTSKSRSEAQIQPGPSILKKHTFWTIFKLLYLEKFLELEKILEI